MFDGTVCKDTMFYYGKKICPVWSFDCKTCLDCIAITKRKETIAKKER